MDKSTRSTHIALLALCLICSYHCPEVRAQTHFSVLTYNLENCFDTIPSSEHDDSSFTATGEHHWTRSRYYRKLNHVAQVVLASDSLHPADIIILQEIEGDTVMNDLLTKSPLRSMQYRYCITHSADVRGVNVAIVYQPLTFTLIESSSLRTPPHKTKSFRPTRDVLRVTGIVPTGDTLDIYALHLPSQLGGRQAKSLRRDVVEMIRRDVDSLFSVRMHPNVMIAGDFNSNPSDKTIREVLETVPWSDALKENAPETLFCNMMLNRKGGSYKYRTEWNWIDQVVVSGNLCKELNPLRLSSFDSVSALSLSPMLTYDSMDGGKKPFRTYLGTYYVGGYSDHLPVVVRFDMR